MESVETFRVPLRSLRRVLVIHNIHNAPFEVLNAAARVAARIVAANLDLLPFEVECVLYLNPRYSEWRLRIDDIVDVPVH